jgi:hypothetical protein
MCVLGSLFAYKQPTKETKKHTNEQTDKQTNEQTNKQTHEPTNQQTNKQTHKQTNEQTNHQTNKHTNKATNKQAHKQTQREDPCLLKTLSKIISCKEKRRFPLTAKSGLALKRTILGTSSWASWQAVWLSKGQQANNLSTVEPACQEAQTDDSGDLFLGLLASRLTVEEAPSEKSKDSRTCLPGGPNGRFLGPPFRPPGKQFDCRKKGRPEGAPGLR